MGTTSNKRKNDQEKNNPACKEPKAFKDLGLSQKDQDNSFQGSNNPQGFNELQTCYDKKLKEDDKNFIGLDGCFIIRTSCCQIEGERGFATGVFCNFDKMSMFCLITCEHVISENMIKKKEKITIIYNDTKNIKKISKEIKLDKRKIFYFLEIDDADITIVELFPDDDGIEKERFLKPFYLQENQNLRDIIGKNKFILLQHPGGTEELKLDNGNITGINENKYSFKHNINTKEGSSGGPLLYKDDEKNFLIFGIHNSGWSIKEKKGNEREIKDDEINKKNEEEKYNKGSFLYIVLNRLNKKIIYDVKEKGEIRIFGKNFVKNNFYNIELFVNGERHILTEYYNFNKIGNNEIFIIENEYITDMSFMFAGCKNNILFESLIDWDLSKVQKMDYMFFWCDSVKSLKSLNNWNVSNVQSMSGLFFECKNLISLEGLKNWNVSNVKNMSHMFSGCVLINSLDELKDWNITKVENLSCMFKYCDSISSIEPLKNWEVTNVKNVEGMFLDCESIKNFETISNWSNSRISIDKMTKSWVDLNSLDSQNE